MIEPNGNTDCVIEELWNLNGEPIKVAPGAGHTVYAKIPCQTNAAYIARYIQGDPRSKLEKISVLEV